MTAKTAKGKTTTGQKNDEVLAGLIAAADAKDDLAFLTAYEQITWANQPAEKFVQAVHLALAAGAHLLARDLSQEGAERYPDHPELAKMAHILAPPVVRTVATPPNTTWKADREWLKAHWREYRGKWVALLNGTLLGEAASLDALIDQIGSTKGTDILVTPIW